MARIRELLSRFYLTDEESCGILPTATQYARSYFLGLMPLQIQQMFPELWVEEEDEGKNILKLIADAVDRFRKKYTFSFNKVLRALLPKVIDQLPRMEIMIWCSLNFVICSHMPVRTAK